MKTFKYILRIVFAAASILAILVAITNFLQTPTVIGMVLFWVNFIDVPLFITFFFMLLYICFFKRKSVPFFKTEIIYFLIHIGAILLLVVSYISCPTCPGQKNQQRILTPCKVYDSGREELSYLMQGYTSQTQIQLLSFILDKSIKSSSIVFMLDSLWGDGK